MPGNPAPGRVAIETIAGSGGDVRQAPAVNQLEASFAKLQLVTMQRTWFWGTILQAASRDWSWR